MFNNKLLNISIIIIISISLLGIAAYFMFQYIFPGSEVVDEKIKELTIDEIIPLTVNVPKINTNLGDSTIIVIELTLQTDNKKAKEEADKRMFQITDNVNLFLKNQTEESFSTEEKINKFKADLITRLNKILSNGKVEKVNITQLFLQ